MKKLIGFAAIVFACVLAFGLFTLSGGSVLAPASSVEPSSATAESGLLGRLKGYFEPSPGEYPTFEGEEVYLGGFPAGIEIMDDITVKNLVAVITNDGSVVPSKDADLAIGDVILSVNGVKPGTVSEMQRLVEKSGGVVVLTVKRGEKEFSVQLLAAKDALTGKLRLGVEVNGGTLGIGTVTYVGKDGVFGVLGHRIGNDENKRGALYPAVINSVKPAERGVAGSLSGSFLPVRPVGIILSNTNLGIFGKWTGPEPKSRVYVGGRDGLSVGSAQIYTTVEGLRPRFYDVEIIRIGDKTTPAEKSFVISVTDENLLALTGGIVQGMSGSPVLQNGKLVGAVTHVVVNEPTKGYGVFADWMLWQGGETASGAEFRAPDRAAPSAA